jgi:hypothetical protein
MKTATAFFAISLSIIALDTSAADFDGSKPLICATIDAHACDPGITCTRYLPADIGAPKFLTLDFDKRVVIGPEHTTPMTILDRSPDQVLIGGTELGYGWTLVVDTADGDMTLSIMNRNDAFVLFGNCKAA